MFPQAPGKTIKWALRLGDFGEDNGEGAWMEEESQGTSITIGGRKKKKPVF